MICFVQLPLDSSSFFVTNESNFGVKSNKFFVILFSWRRSFYCSGIFLCNAIAAFEIQVLNTSAIKCWGNFRIFQFASAIRWKKNCWRLTAETFSYYIGNGCGICWHFAKGCDLFFQQLRLLVLPKSYCLLITHLNGWNGRQYLSRSLPCFSFFMDPCNIRRTHPTLWKLLEILSLHETPNI